MGWELRGWGDAPRGEVIHDPENAAEGERYVTASWTWHWNASITDVVKDRPIVLRWQNRFVPPETRYPVRVGISGWHPETPEANVPISGPHWSTIKSETPVRYAGRLLDRLDLSKEQDEAARSALMVYLAEAGPDWVERTIEVTPEADGELELTLHGARRRDREAGVYQPVLVDYVDIEVAGASLVHPGLTDQDGDGLPDGWRRIGDDTEFAIMREADGASFARTWYQAGLRTTLRDVVAEQPVVITMQVREHVAR